MREYRLKYYESSSSMNTFTFIINNRKSFNRYTLENKT